MFPVPPLLVNNMSLSEIIQLVQNKLTHLRTVRLSAYSAGDMAKVLDLDSQIELTQTTLATLQRVQGEQES